MPYIKKNRRKEFDKEIEAIIKKLHPDKKPEEMSYIILKLLVKGLGVGVRDGILVNGVMSETLANYNKYIFMSQEDRILLQRWLDPDGSWA